MGLSESIERITRAGFTLTVEDGRLMVEPFSALSDVQLTWLRANKAAIMALLDSDQGGHDLPPANDADQGRITVGVPAGRLPDLEKALTVERQQPGTLPADLTHAALAVCKAYGDGEAAQAAMLVDLRHYPPGQYPALTAHFRAKLRPVRCVDCAHADIDAGIAKCRAGVEAKLPTQGYWYTDAHVCPWHFQARDPPNTAHH